MDKELELAINFAKAPKELQEAATAYHTSLKASAKIVKSLAEKNAELLVAEKNSSELRKQYRKLLDAWEI